MIKSGGCERANAIANSPVAASATAYPALPSTVASSSRSAGRPSTTRTEVTARSRIAWRRASRSGRSRSILPTKVSGLVGPAPHTCALTLDAPFVGTRRLPQPSERRSVGHLPLTPCPPMSPRVRSTTIPGNQEIGARASPISRERPGEELVIKRNGRGASERSLATTSGADIELRLRSGC